MDRCRATSVEQQQQQQQRRRRSHDVTGIAIGGYGGISPSVGQQQHRQFLSAAGATVLSAHQSTVVAIGGGEGYGTGGGIGGRGGGAAMVVDDGSSGYGSPDSETGLEPATAAAAVAVGGAIAPSVVATAPPVQ